MSQGGLYIATDHSAQVGELVTIDLSLPDGNTVGLGGKVVNVVDSATAAQLGRPPGLGIQLDELDEPTRKQFDQLVMAARQAQPRPDLEFAFPPADSGPLAAPASPDTPSETVSEAVLSPASEVVHLDLDVVVGIDLGTTYTSVATSYGGKVLILPRSDGTRSAPSVVSFAGREPVLGGRARARIASDPRETVASPKRLLGLPYDDPDVQSFVRQVAYPTRPGPDGTTVVELGGRGHSITELCSYLLADAREVAERALGRAVTRAVLTAPISYDDGRVAFLEQAARMAGLELAAVVDEPSAAALASRFEPEFGGVVGVYDFGGGTFDFSIVDVSRGDFRVLASTGETWLGGDDIDSALAEIAADAFHRQHDIDMRESPEAWQRLLFACEQAKRRLSSDEAAMVAVPEILAAQVSVTRAQLAGAAQPLIERSFEVCRQALDLVSMETGELDAVYLSGGTSNALAVREAVAGFFAVPVRTGVPPEHAVCLGAAVHAAQTLFHRPS